MKSVAFVSLVFGIIVGFLSPLLAPLYLFRITSGYSDQKYWVAFHTPPSEEQLLDAVIYRDPLIADRLGTAGEWRAARDASVRLYIKKDAGASVLAMPYEAEKNPDDVFKDGTRIKGIWLTEPSRRTQYPVAVVIAGYVLGTALAVSALVFCLFVLARSSWYFLLHRISELSQAIRQKP